MHSNAVIALAIVAAAGPALAYPAIGPHARRQAFNAFAPASSVAPAVATATVTVAATPAATMAPITPPALNFTEIISDGEALLQNIESIFQYVFFSE